MLNFRSTRVWLIFTAIASVISYVVFVFPPKITIAVYDKNNFDSPIIDIRANPRINRLLSLEVRDKVTGERLWRIHFRHSHKQIAVRYGILPNGAVQDWPLTGEAVHLRNKDAIILYIGYQYDSVIPPAPASNTIMSVFDLAELGPPPQGKRTLSHW